MMKKYGRVITKDRKERVATVWRYGEVNDLGGYYTYNKDDAYCLSARFRPKWANALFLEIKHPFALFLKLNRELPLLCNSII